MIYVRTRMGGKGREIGLLCDDCDTEFITHYPDTERAEEPTVADLASDARRHECADPARENRSRLAPAWSPPPCWCCAGALWGNPLRKCAACFGSQCGHRAVGA